jgi:membrane protease YdiL (CAAX protease family)
MIHAPAGRGLSRVGAAAGRPELRDIPVAFGYSLVIVLGELSASWVGAIPGALVDAALVPVILTHFVLQPDARHRRMFPALALIALLRILSVAAVVPRLPEDAWYAAVGLPVLAGAFLAGRLADEPAARLGLRVTRERLDTSLVLAGIPLSLVGYLLLRPAELSVSGDLVSTMVAMAVLAVFGGFLEEYVYRGVLQSASIDAFGSRRAGILFAATLGACMYWGSGSIPFMIAMWFMGIGYGLALSRGASLWGAAGGHTIMLWGMGLVWPLLLR